MTIDWDATVAWIAFGVAIITPVITTYLNNRQQLKLKKLEIEQNELTDTYLKKKDTYVKYLQSASSLILEHSYMEDWTKYKSSYCEIFLYCPLALRTKIELLDSYVASRKFDNEISILLLDITKLLSDDLNTAKR